MSERHQSPVEEIARLKEELKDARARLYEYSERLARLNELAQKGSVPPWMEEVIIDDEVSFKVYRLREQGYDERDCDHVCCDEQVNPFHDHFLTAEQCPRCEAV